MAMSPFNSDLIFTVGHGYINNAYRIQTSRTTDGGITWLHDTLPDSMARANTLVFDPFNPNRIFIGGDSLYSYKLLLVSTDIGATWNHIGSGLTGAVYCLAAVPTTPGFFYAGTSQGLFRSTDTGSNWIRTGSFTNVRAVCVHPENENVVYAGTGTGVYLTTDGGTTWEQINQGLNNTNVLSLAIRGDTNATVFVGTNGAGIFTSSPPTGINDYKKPQHNRIPVIAAEPNPCRRTLTLTAHLPTDFPISLELYDRSGRLVQYWKQITSSSGHLKWTVDLFSLPAGVYILQIKQNHITVGAKTIVVTK